MEYIFKKNTMYNFAKKLFPICRSITGDGVRKTLDYIKDEIGELKIYEIKSGTKCFDWIVPEEWNINDAYIITPSKKKIADFKKNNLHILNYSEPINKTLSLNELKKNLYSIPNYPDAIPYVTSYYKRRWGFCLSHNQIKRLKSGQYKVFIDSSLKKGSLSYGELVLKGKSKKEILISTYICHPSMGNNETSGMVLTTFLAKWLKSKKRRYTYRIIFIPETIGSIVYISKNLSKLKKNVFCGFNVTCVGDNNRFSFLPSRNGKTFADKVALSILNDKVKKFDEYSFLDRGSDERQFCSPKVDLPMVSIMRTKYGTYPEYHTSKDDLSFISDDGLNGTLKIHCDCISYIEKNFVLSASNYCEPHLGRLGLYSDLGLSRKGHKVKGKILLDILAYCDSKNDLFDISNILNQPLSIVFEASQILLDNKLVKVASV